MYLSYSLYCPNIPTSFNGLQIGKSEDSISWNYHGPWVNDFKYHPGMLEDCSYVLDGVKIGKWTAHLKYGPTRNLEKIKYTYQPRLGIFTFSWVKK